MDKITELANRLAELYETVAKMSIAVSETNQLSGRQMLFDKSEFLALHSCVADLLGQQNYPSSRYQEVFEQKRRYFDAKMLTNLEDREPRVASRADDRPFEEVAGTPERCPSLFD